MSAFDGMTKQRLKAEAERLINDDILNLAFDAARDEALDALSVADVDDKTMMLRLQAKCAVIQEVRDKLYEYILRGGGPVTSGPE